MKKVSLSAMEKRENKCLSKHEYTRVSTAREIVCRPLSTSIQQQPLFTLATLKKLE
ncbi:hypothetical protein ALC53_00790 [Atta colombica]|uniref:Uncharacterized protein n=1 Tax=Atta colombica TaxID=520822 RepID=A0A195BVN7_9HYME|nr:hypothetical protein ALC53_00790 [Atta colombica]